MQILFADHSHHLNNDFTVDWHAKAGPRGATAGLYDRFHTQGYVDQWVWTWPHLGHFETQGVLNDATPHLTIHVTWSPLILGDHAKKALWAIQTAAGPYGSEACRLYVYYHRIASTDSYKPLGFRYAVLRQTSLHGEAIASADAGVRGMYNEFIDAPPHFGFNQEKTSTTKRSVYQRLKERT